ncbi:ester cyclase [Streptomyces sp. NBC_00344]|uniref:ester cyclase n=1 Tax=Streptomyces sp. NBC_00344 TaxID=2975720 RepID=UPI002E1E593A
MSDRKQSLAATWDSVWNRGEVDDLDSLLKPGYVRHSSIADHSATQLKGSVVAARLAFPDLHVSIEDSVAEGDRLATRWHGSATHTGSYLGVPPTGRALTVSGVTISRFEGATIAEEWVTWDPRGLLGALGIISLGNAA